MTPPPALADEPRLVNRMIMNHFKFRDPGGEGLDGIERQGLNPVMNAFLEYVDGHRARKFGPQPLHSGERLQGFRGLYVEAPAEIETWRATNSTTESDNAAKPRGNRP